MTVNTFASTPWPSTPVSVNSPSQPVADDSSCACVSCPSLNSIRTSVHAIPDPVEPSSASVTEIRYGILSPKSAILPFSGISMLTCGRELPAITVTLSTLVAPDSSVTVSVTLYVPAVVKVCWGFGSVDVPPSPKFHA